MNLQESIIRILREETKLGKYISDLEDLTEDYKNLRESENKKSSLLSNVEENGLYEVIVSTGLHINQVEQVVGQLSREVLERYIKDFVKNEGSQLGNNIDSDTGFVFPIPLSKNKEVESFYLSKGVLTLEINIYDSNDRKVAGSYEKLQNLSDSEINRIVKEIIDWGGDTYYEI